MLDFYHYLRLDIFLELINIHLTLHHGVMSISFAEICLNIHIDRHLFKAISKF